MNQPMTMALALAVGLVLLGGTTAFFQIRGLRRLAARHHVPSDEYAYLRARFRRRLLTAMLLIGIAALLAGAYLSGMESRADQLGEPRPVPAEGAEKPKMTEEQKQFFRTWAIYWIVVIGLVFVILILALLDAVATRRYWLAQYRAMQEEHNTRLRRDLAVYRQQKDHSRGARLGPLITDPDPEPE